MNIFFVVEMQAIIKLLSWKNEPVHEKTDNLVSDQVQHKPGCTVTEDGQRLEI